jgi:hypothetical protein
MILQDSSFGARGWKFLNRTILWASLQGRSEIPQYMDHMDEKASSTQRGISIYNNVVLLVIHRIVFPIKINHFSITIIQEFNLLWCLLSNVSLLQTKWNSMSKLLMILIPW